MDGELGLPGRQGIDGPRGDKGARGPGSLGWFLNVLLTD